MNNKLRNTKWKTATQMHKAGEVNKELGQVIKEGWQGVRSRTRHTPSGTFRIKSAVREGNEHTWGVKIKP